MRWLQVSSDAWAERPAAGDTYEMSGYFLVDELGAHNIPACYVDGRSSSWLRSASGMRPGIAGGTTPGAV